MPRCGLNPGLGEVSGLTGNWQLPTVNFGACNPPACGSLPPYDPGSSPQFGNFGAGSGLLSTITTGNLGTLATVTDPSPFALSESAWFQGAPSSWALSNWWGSGSGIVEFFPQPGQFIAPYPTQGPPYQQMGPAGVWLNAPITTSAFAYDPPPSPMG